MNICPCCKRVIRESKQHAQDKRLTDDLDRCKASIRACESAMNNPFFALRPNPDWRTREENPNVADVAMLEAIKDHLVRLNKALHDHKLLWSMYRRADKKTPYYLVEVAEEIAA